MCQFSWYCDVKSAEPKDSKTWIKSVQVANNFIMNEHPDITEGAMWYHAYYINPYWAKHLNETVQINAHIFYKCNTSGMITCNVIQRNGKTKLMNGLKP